MSNTAKTQWGQSMKVSLNSSTIGVGTEVRNEKWHSSGSDTWRARQREPITGSTLGWSIYFSDRGLSFLKACFRLLHDDDDDDDDDEMPRTIMLVLPLSVCLPFWFKQRLGVRTPKSSFKRVVN